ncbi:hypothetical protein CHOED_046 [Vibrio phage CHOED]|uniref:hypothetical protein n=1 Tax=Vibrio phage CHOED TaxID=1458716 RepID=UPI00042F6254|nr:hypothetical protein CHOED_046 [Vibrio phage CHOED]AHK11906.1 hypothetical protein CHOED_046 [Vibrio phage CHOED]
MLQHQFQWLRIYLAPHSDRDAHSEFAEAIGVSRSEAKEICYRNIYQPETPWLIKHLMRMQRQDYLEHTQEIKALKAKLKESNKC